MVKAFQFSVTLDVNPPTEVLNNGKMVLTDIINANTIGEAMGKVDQNWLITNGYRIFRPIRK